MSYMEYDELQEIPGQGGEAAPEGGAPPYPLEGEPPGGIEADPFGVEASVEADGEPGGEPEALGEGAEAGTEALSPAEGESGSGAAPELPAGKPKRKRTSRKKAEESPPENPVDGEAPEDEATPSDEEADVPAGPDGSGGESAPDTSEHGDDEQDTETSAFVLEEAEAGTPLDAPLDGEETGAPESPPPAEAPAEQSARGRRTRRTASTARAANRPKAQFASKPLDNKPTLLSLNLNELDQDLTGEEREEWNAIYASYRSKSLLTGRIMGIDSHSFTVRSRETGQTQRRRMLCAVIISYRVKVLIPETEVWYPGQERPPYVLRNMSGAEIDYTILDVDREGGVAIGSRRMALAARRHFFDAVKGGRTIGEKLTCRVLSVGPKRCLVECGGRDLNLSQKDLTYTSTPDLRERYHPGQTMDCILKEYDRQSGQMWISVKETMANPFLGAIKRHPIGSRRQAVISGKYGGGVFCTLPDETVCLCLYSTRHSDSDFHVGDTVILAIKQFDYERSLIYGRILSKW